jgi:predicted dehydrogenase
MNGRAAVSNVVKGGPTALVVGAGVMGVWHVHALKRLGIEVSGVVDPDAARASALSRRAGGCAVFSSVTEALAAGGHACAHVCTPLAAHVPLASELLSAGVHVLIEKPVAPSPGETRELLDRARERKLILCPVHQFLYQRGFLASAAALGGAGTVLHVDTVAASAGARGGLKRAEEVMADILPHPLSLMRRILGPAFAQARWHVTDGPPGELRVSGRAGDVSLGILITMRGRPTRNTVRIMCEGGTFHVDLFHGYAVQEPPGVSRVRKALRPLTLAGSSMAAAGSNLVRRALRGEPAYPGLRELIGRFYRAVQGSPPPIPEEEVMDVARAHVELMDARHRQASAS